MAQQLTSVANTVRRIGGPGFSSCLDFGLLSLHEACIYRVDCLALIIIVTVAGSA